MMQEANNYLKVLLYLKQFEGDGRTHEIENLLDPVESESKKQIYYELAREELIQLEGGHDNSGAFIAFGGKVYGPDEIVYYPFKAKITFKGSKYLKEELEKRDQSKYHITVGNNSNANFNINSPNAKAIIENRSEIIERAKKMFTTIQEDTSISEPIREEALGVIRTLIAETNQGASNKDTINKLLTLGSNVSSIGSMVLGLLPYLQVL